MEERSAAETFSNAAKPAEDSQSFYSVDSNASSSFLESFKMQKTTSLFGPETWLPSELVTPASLGAVEQEPLMGHTTIEVPETTTAATHVDVAAPVEEQRFQLWKGTEFLRNNLFSSKVSLLSNGAPLCRICHTTSSTRQNPLISPCRCSGSLLYVHKGCIVRWLEMSTRKMVPSPRCELCGYDYRRGNVLNMRSVHMPHVSRSSCVLNVLFLVALLLMVGCGILGVRFIQENALYRQRIAYQTAQTAQPTYTWRRRGYFGGALNGDPPQLELVDSSSFTAYPALSMLFDAKVVVCLSLFLASFIVALFTQYRAEASIFRCIFRFFVINRNWMIRNYDIRDDPEMQARRKARSASAQQAPEPLVDPGHVGHGNATRSSKPCDASPSAAPHPVLTASAII